MNKFEFTYLSSDNKTDIHAIKWVPDTEIKAILQICHGMVEFIDRYDEFATYLADNGILVVGNDHLGHGQSVTEKENLGYFSENGNQNVIQDMNTLHLLMLEEYKNIPYFILGHSMGSFLTRQYLIGFSDTLAGAIIMGTGFKPTAVTKMGMFMCTVISKFKGEKHRSNFINNMGMGTYNKKFGAKDGKEWLSRNKENVEKYINEPLNSFTFTLNGYYNLFKGLNIVCNEKEVSKMRKDLPVLFVSGSDDPVGDFGVGVKKTFDMFKKVGMQNVEMKLYKDDRHEILNEVDRKHVFEDMLGFILKGVK